MAASYKTVEEVAKIIFRHVPHSVSQDIARDLEHVPGNQSFRDTIEMLVIALRARRPTADEIKNSNTLEAQFAAREAMRVKD